MENDWLTAAGFEQVPEIVSAVNTLSIHAKLTLAGVPDPTPEDEIGSSRLRLTSLLERLGGLVKAAERHVGGAVVGADPRTRELAEWFLGRQAHGERRLPTPRVSPEALLSLIQSDRPEDLCDVIVFLDELRRLVEEKARADVFGVLGDR